MMLFTANAHAATIVAPNGEVTYVNPSTGGYSTTNANTGEYTTYIQSGDLTTVIPDNGMGAPQTYMTTDGIKPIILDTNGEE